MANTSLLLSHSYSPFTLLLFAFHTPPIRLSHSSYSPFTLLLAFPSFLSHPSVLPLHPPILSHSCHTSALLSFHTLFLPLSISTGTPPSSCRIPHFLLSRPLIFVSLFTLVLAHPSFPATLFLAYPSSFLVTPLLSFFHTPPFTSSYPSHSTWQTPPALFSHPPVLLSHPPVVLSHSSWHTPHVLFHTLLSSFHIPPDTPLLSFFYTRPLLLTHLIPVSTHSFFHTPLFILFLSHPSFRLTYTFPLFALLFFPFTPLLPSWHTPSLSLHTAHLFFPFTQLRLC